MLDWQRIDTVFLDMDGTLLDLHYDNHFWLQHVPARFAEKHSLPFEEAHRQLLTRYQSMMGTMQWYCVDYWTGELGLDIEALKQEVAHLIAVHPHVVPFLEQVRMLGKRVVLATNAHHKSLALKMEKTGLERYFDALVCAHEFGMPKENPEFWDLLQKKEAFSPEATLLIDDSLPVLRSARDYGTKQARKNVEEFQAIEDFAQILPS